MKTTAVTMAAAVLALGLAAGPALAQTAPDTEQRIKELEKKVDDLQKATIQIPDLKLASGAEVERETEPYGLAGFYDSGYLVFTSKDGAFKYWLDGRLNLDAATYIGSENRLPSGVEVRRARIGVKATLWTDWLAELDVDFADNVVEMKDMWAGYAGFKNSLIKAGNFKAPFGLETLTSSKYITFQERPYIDSWAPDRRLGLSYTRWGKSWQFTLGVFGPEAGAFDDKDTLTGGGAGTSEEFSPVGRFTFAPLHDKGKVLHFGIAAAHRKPDVSKITTSGADLVDRVNAARIVKFDSRPETHVSRAKFLSTGDMKYVDSYDQFGAEFAGVFGSLSVQGEYQQTKVNRIATTVANYSDHTFDGYYGQVMWFVTGETRPYSVSEGEFGRVLPKHKGGALELGIRYSTMDLNDITPVDPIKGGSAVNITLGATWYINPNHKIILNVVSVNNDEYAKPGKDWAPIPSGNGTTFVPVAGDDFTIIQARYQIAF